MRKKIRLIKLIRNITIVIITLLIIITILGIAPSYKNDEVVGKINLVINSNNITSSLKHNVFVRNDVIYISRADILNFFDPYIYYNDDEKRIVTSSSTKVASMVIDDSSITINGKEYTLSSPAIIENNTVYLPFSLIQNIYNAETEYITSTNIVNIETLNREKITATANSNITVKSRKKWLSRTVDKINGTDTVVVISTSDDGWARVRTANGKIGYVEQDKLSNITTIRETQEKQPIFVGTVNMVWDDYYSNILPNRTDSIPGLNVISPTSFDLVQAGKGEIVDRFGNYEQYLGWARDNNVQVWPTVSNHGNLIDTTSEIMNSYKYRSNLIENIVSIVQKYNLDGINLDFENMYEKDVDMFTQFLVELYPRLHELNAVLSVDVTAPDGAPTWSLCYNRHEIANNCDYIIFMAYDQYSTGSKKAGPTSAYNWVQLGLNKFLTREEIDSSKIILALPFYARRWEENSSGEISNTAIMMRSIASSLPNLLEKHWLEDERQYYVEYTIDDTIYKMWIEDERSLREKLSLVTENKLGRSIILEQRL